MQKMWVGVTNLTKDQQSKPLYMERYGSKYNEGKNKTNDRIDLDIKCPECGQGVQIHWEAFYCLNERCKHFTERYPLSYYNKWVELHCH